MRTPAPLLVPFLAPLLMGLSLLACDRGLDSKPSGGASDVSELPQVDPEVGMKDDPVALARFTKMSEAFEDEELLKLLPPYLEKHPNSEQGHNLLGWSYLHTEQVDEAEVAFKRAAEIDPTWDGPYIGLGVVWRKREKLDRAVEYYNRAIKFNSRSAEAYASLVVVELQRGNHDEAVEAGAKAWQLDNQNPGIAANLAVAYHYAGDTAKRDEMYAAAKALGYRKLDKLDGIFSGELEVP